MRRSVLLGSIAVHAAIAALLYGIGRRAPAPPPPRPPIDIEIVPPALAPAPAPGGASPAPALAGASPAPAPAPARTLPAPAPRPAPAAAPGLTPAAPAAAATNQLAITGYDRGAPGDTGEGTGVGGGRGFGLGAGAGIGELLALPPPPPAPPPPPVEKKSPSKARPPKLVYPKRDREADAAETFVARLSVDTDGYVVGARLIRGIGGARDELAAQLVWRFRYAPALDDEGRAIRATIEQPFLVGH